MAFIKRATTAGREGKAYLWVASYWGNGLKLWAYVTTDANTTVEVSGYFRDDEINGRTVDTDVRRGTMQPGDQIMVYQVGSLLDTRDIEEDIRAQLVDYSRHIVLASDGSGVEISPDIEAATITYTS